VPAEPGGCRAPVLGVPTYHDRMTDQRGADISITDLTVRGRDGEIPVRDYRPAGERRSEPFLWVHGGAFSAGGLDQRESDAPARYLAERGRWVRTIDYRLVPDARLFREPDLSPHPNRFPAALHDVVDVYADLAASSPSVSLGGASAGANLSAGATLLLRDEGAALPRRLVLAYGAFHAPLPAGDDIEASLHGLLARWLFNDTMVRRIITNYVGDPALVVPGYAIPGGTELHGFPPTLAVDAANDRLRRSGHAFAGELSAAGVPVTETVVDARHGFLNSPKKDAFAIGMRWIDDFLRAA
jgi:acetyl esterase/lipase